MAQLSDSSYPSGWQWLIDVDSLPMFTVLPDRLCFAKSTETSCKQFTGRQTLGLQSGCSLRNALDEVETFQSQLMLSRSCWLLPPLLIWLNCSQRTTYCSLLPCSIWSFVTPVFSMWTMMPACEIQHPNNGIISVICWYTLCLRRPRRETSENKYTQIIQTPYELKWIIILGVPDKLEIGSGSVQLVEVYLSRKSSHGRTHRDPWCQRAGCCWMLTGHRSMKIPQESLTLVGRRWPCLPNHRKDTRLWTSEILQEK